MIFSRLKIILPALAVFVLAGLWTVYWFVVKSEAVHRFTAHRLETGKPQLNCGREAWSGYPFRITLACEAARISLPGNSAVTRWQGDFLDATVQAYNLTHLIARHKGPASLFDAGGKLADYRHRQMRSSHRFARSGSQTHALQADSLDITAARGDRLTIATLALFAGLETETTQTRLHLNAKTLQYNGVLPEPLAISGLVADVTIPQLIDLEDFNRQWLIRTRPEIEISRIQITAPGIILDVTGSGHLTTAGYLTGRFKTQLTGFGSFLDLLVSQRAISAKQASNATILLGLFRQAGGGDKLVVDFIARDGELYWGPVKLGRHQPLF